ncbi:OmpA family protein [Loktanella fryxellensis]|uniref:OmpA family protein n=1 Tax=Loktanella fryxellensis TaxID=245187 RepID=UPI0015A5BE58|nr:OmpA family protein [Loktanella fryxellensis]
MASPLSAQEVTITSQGGDLQLTGRVAGFDGTYLEIEGPHGPVIVDLARVTCAGAACPPQQGYVPTLRMSGEPVLSGFLLPALLEGFAADRGLSLSRADDAITLTTADGTVALHVVLTQTGSAEAFADLITFATDVALTLREPSPDERARAAAVGLSLTAPADGVILLGNDALVPVVSPRNPVRTLAPADLIAAYAGQVADWAAMGQTDTPLTLHLGLADSGAVEAFLAQLDAPPATTIVHHPTAAALALAVADDPGALGLATLADAGVAQTVTLRDACGLTASPRSVDLHTQDYPLTMPAFALVRSAVQPAIVVDLLGWLRSPAAAAIVRRSGLADRTVVPVPLNDQGERIAHAIDIAGPQTSLTDLQATIAQLRARSRLSLTFRFAEGALALDAASAANLRRLALDIRDGVHGGRDILLAGFTDGAGEAQANRDLSAARALAVEAALLDLLGTLPADVDLGTVGYGEAMPIACDDIAWGRRMNRRVEVWIGD